MSNSTEVLSFFRRVAETLSRTHEIPPLNGLPAQTSDRVIGVVPMHLRYWYNLYHALEAERDSSPPSSENDDERLQRLFDMVHQLFYNAVTEQVPPLRRVVVFSIRDDWSIVDRYNLEDRTDAPTDKKFIEAISDPSCNIVFSVKGGTDD